MGGLLLSLFGISVAWAFHVNQYQSYNLNWICFPSNNNNHNHNNNHDSIMKTFGMLLIKISSFVILLFPAFDIISAFRMKSIALGNNILETFFNHDSTTNNNNNDDDSSSAIKINNYKRNSIRTIIGIIPIILIQGY